MVIFNNFSYCFAQPVGGFKQILSAVTNAQTFSIEFLAQLFGFRCRHPYVWQSESCEFRGTLNLITKDKFITHILALMGDLSKKFSKLEIMCPCPCGADKISPVLIEKLQKVRNIIGRPIIITSGVRCEFYNASIKVSINSGHIRDDHGI